MSTFASASVNLMTSALTGAFLGNDPILSTHMKIMTWNCRDARRQDFKTAARRLFTRYNPDVVIFMDTKLSVDQSNVVVNRLFYRENIIVAAGEEQEGSGFSGIATTPQ